MPGKYSHGVVLAEWSSLGLIDRPNHDYVGYLQDRVDASRESHRRTMHDHPQESLFENGDRSLSFSDGSYIRRQSRKGGLQLSQQFIPPRRVIIDNSSYAQSPAKKEDQAPYVSQSTQTKPSLMALRPELATDKKNHPAARHAERMQSQEDTPRRTDRCKLPLVTKSSADESTFGGLPTPPSSSGSPSPMTSQRRERLYLLDSFADDIGRRRSQDEQDQKPILRTEDKDRNRDKLRPTPSSQSIKTQIFNPGIEISKDGFPGSEFGCDNAYNTVELDKSRARSSKAENPLSDPCDKARATEILKDDHDQAFDADLDDMDDLASLSTFLPVDTMSINKDHDQLVQLGKISSRPKIEVGHIFPRGTSRPILQRAFLQEKSNLDPSYDLQDHGAIEDLGSLPCSFTPEIDRGLFPGSTMLKRDLNLDAASLHTPNSEARQGQHTTNMVPIPVVRSQKEISLPSGQLWAHGIDPGYQTASNELDVVQKLKSKTLGTKSKRGKLQKRIDLPQPQLEAKAKRTPLDRSLSNTANSGQSPNRTAAADARAAPRAKPLTLAAPGYREQRSSIIPAFEEDSMTSQRTPVDDKIIDLLGSFPHDAGTEAYGRDTTHLLSSPTPSSSASCCHEKVNKLSTIPSLSSRSSSNASRASAGSRGADGAAAPYPVVKTRPQWNPNSNIDLQERDIDRLVASGGKRGNVPRHSNQGHDLQSAYSQQQHRKSGKLLKKLGLGRG